MLQAQAPQQTAGGEMAIHDESVTFRSRVNLVMVPVVVRDKNGHATGDLHQEDFLLFDNGKPQSITRFSVEKGGMARATPAQEKSTEPAPKTDEPEVVVGEHYTIYLFDDIHANFGDLAHVRDAALRHLDKTMKPTDRAAIFTTSGQGIQDFTIDMDKLRAALMGLRTRPIARSNVQECPDINYYVADLIRNRNDTMAKSAMVEQAMGCMGLDPKDPNSITLATSAVDSGVMRAQSSGEQETHVSLTVIRDAIRRLSVVPGQRTIVIASPGFITPFTSQYEKTEIVDRAIRASVVINTIDARGLYTDPSFDASRSGMGGTTRYLRDSASAEGDVLIELATGTGGTYVHNSNDFEEGFRRVAGAPDYVYLLGFSPQNLKVDGKFHQLKVSLKSSKGLSLQARRGFFAPKATLSPEETAKQEVEEALFSREEMRDIPVEFRTQFFKKDEFSAKLSVISKIDIRHLHFRKDEGRNYDDLTVVTALFDRNGTLVHAVKQLVQMKLLDATVATKIDSGVALKTGFDVQPGGYAVRVVVRDSEGQLMSAANGSVNIP